jgi:Tfp pilus assembly protein PilF
MLRACVPCGLLTAAALFIHLQPAAADTYQVIVTGKVTMEDGSPPPFTVGIERVCSDIQGSAPGPITNKKGEYLWHMEIDAFNSRSCVIRATHPGYVSTSEDVSGINATSHDTQYTVKTLILSKKVPDPYAIVVNSDDIPFRAKSSFNAAMKSLDTPNYAQAASQFADSVKASPKFAAGWHALGVVDERLERTSEARDAFEHSIKADPKFLQAYVTLARLCLRIKDWDCAAMSAAAGVKVDKKHLYVELYLHQAVAQYEMKDLADAESSVKQAIELDPGHRQPREEYVLGRILEAKGDMEGAKEHMAQYLKLDPNPPDVDVIRGHLQNLGKSDAAEPALEVL